MNLQDGIFDSKFRQKKRRLCARTKTFALKLHPLRQFCSLFLFHGLIDQNLRDESWKPFWTLWCCIVVLSVLNRFTKSVLSLAPPVDRHMQLIWQNLEVLPLKNTNSLRNFKKKNHLGVDCIQLNQNLWIKLYRFVPMCFWIKRFLEVFRGSLDSGPALWSGL